MLIDARKADAPPGMVPVNTQGKPAGVLYDHGTGQRIPMARAFNSETGEWEALTPAPNGVDYVCDAETGAPIIRRGRSKGRLELVPIGQAATIGVPPPKPQPVTPPKPLSVEERRDGLECYRKVHREVWQGRGDSKRVVDSKFQAYLMQHDFLDAYIFRT